MHLFFLGIVAEISLYKKEAKEDLKSRGSLMTGMFRKERDLDILMFEQSCIQ